MELRGYLINGTLRIAGAPFHWVLQPHQNEEMQSYESLCQIVLC